MQLIKVDELIPHRKNSYFFDDIEGESWFAFIDSIKTSGVIEPVIATQDKVIVSGHQRVRACKEIGIEKVWCDIRTFDSEDEILKQLIETNIRQRGVGNTNPVKFGRCITELERIYEIKHGNNQHSTNGGNLKSQSDLQTETGLDKESYRRYKKLAELPEDIQQMVIDGVVTPSVASRVIARLSPEEQELLAEQIGSREKVSSSEVQKYIDEIKSIREENAKLRTAVSEQGARNAKLQNELNQKVVEVKEVEVAPADYNTLKAKAKEADAWKKDYHKEQERVGEKNKEILELQDRIKRLQEQTVLEQNNQDMTASAIMFALQCRNFIEAVGGYVFISEHLNELPERERVGYLKAVQAVHDWSHILQENMERGNSELLTGH